MKKLIALSLLTLATMVAAQTPAAEKSALSPAEQSIAAAKKEIERKPTQFSGYNQLAIALSRRARETSDVSYYMQAEDALKRSQDLAPTQS